MSRTDVRANLTLPVTAEVGGEGGSYADPTMQVATFRQNEPRYDVPTQEGHQPSAETDGARGMLRYPTEPPAPRVAHSSLPTNPWRVGLLGAAAGAAAGAAVAFGLRKRGRGLRG